MSIPVLMPQLGLTMEEGTVTIWLKNPGDLVTKEEPLLTMTTDKAEVEVESPADGTLGQILVKAGEAVPVGTILAYIECGKEVTGTIGREQSSSEELQTRALPTEASQPRRSEPASRQEARSTGAPRTSRAVSPRAKRLARDLGLNIEDITSGGHAGPIREIDVQQAATHGVTPSKTNDGHRKLISERLTRSVQTIPTFSVSAEANAEKLLAFHEFLRASPVKVASAKVTVTDLLLKILAEALKESPDLNAVWLDNSVHRMTSIDIGLAVDTSGRGSRLRYCEKQTHLTCRLFRPSGLNSRKRLVAGDCP